MSTMMPQEPEGKTAKRKAIPKRVRFEVLRRDNHTCRYCRSTENPLTVDHVLPVVLGGTDDPSNLVAACVDCNAGKSSSSPSSETVAQVSDDAVRWADAVRKAAIAMLAGDDALKGRLDAIESHWDALTPGYRQGQPRYRLPSDWRQTVGGLLASGLPDAMVLDSIDVAMSRPQLDNAFRYVIGVANKKLAKLHEGASALLASADAADDESSEYQCSSCNYHHPRNECGFWSGWRLGMTDCAVMHTDTTQGRSAHPDHYSMMALSRVVDRSAHEWAATWPFPSELYPTYSGRATH